MAFTFEHIHLRSSDVAAAVKFYQANLDATDIDTSRADGTIGVTIGGAIVLISPVANSQVVDSALADRSLDHFALTVPNLAETAACLKANGVVFSRGPLTARPGLQIAFITAPDNVKIELIQRG